MTSHARDRVTAFVVLLALGLAWVAMAAEPANGDEPPKFSTDADSTWTVYAPPGVLGVRLPAYPDSTVVAADTTRVCAPGGKLCGVLVFDAGNVVWSQTEPAEPRYDVAPLVLTMWYLRQVERHSLAAQRLTVQGFKAAGWLRPVATAPDTTEGGEQ